LSFRGDQLLHGGDPLIRGRRYIIVAFCYASKEDVAPRFVFGKTNENESKKKRRRVEEASKSDTGSFSFGFKF
jgi:hypothetical protein